MLFSESYIFVDFKDMSRESGSFKKSEMYFFKELSLFSSKAIVVKVLALIIFLKATGVIESAIACSSVKYAPVFLVQV